MIIYLSDVPEGGQTVFPVTKAGKKACQAKWHTGPTGEQLYGLQNCCEEDSPGGKVDGLLKIQSKRGRALLFFNHRLDGKQDWLAEHGACPILKGEKWIMQRWFRYKPHMGLVHPKDQRFDGIPPAAPQWIEGARPGHGDLRVLSQKKPRIYIMDDFLSAAECEHLRSIADTAGLLSMTAAGEVARHSLTPEAEVDDALVSDIVKRMHRVARTPEGYAEALEFLSFGLGANLSVHMDSQPDQNALRPLTLMVYLDGDGTSQAGGATFFPLGVCDDVESCCGVNDNPDQQVRSYEFNLKGQKKLGLQIKPSTDNAALDINGVHPGVFADWNKANPEKRLEAGSSIIEVNGVGGDAQKILAQLKKGGTITLKTLAGRKPLPLNVPPKAGRAVLIYSHHIDGKGPVEAARYGACPAGPSGKLVLQRFFRIQRMLNVRHRPDPRFDLFAQTA